MQSFLFIHFGTSNLRCLNCKYFPLCCICRVKTEYLKSSDFNKVYSSHFFKLLLLFSAMIVRFLTKRFIGEYDQTVGK